MGRRKTIFIAIITIFMLSSCRVSKEGNRDKKEDKKKDEIQYLDLDEEKDKKLEMAQTLNGVQIGEKHRLNIIQSVQENGYYCGPACIQMILRYFGIEKSQKELAQALHTNSITGTEYLDMTNVLNNHLFGKNPENDTDGGYRVQTLSINDCNPEIKSMLEKRLRDNIDHNYPSIVAANVKSLYPDLMNGNHVLVCVGYILKYNSDEVAFYYMMDPSYLVQDNQYGGLKIFTPDQLVNAIVENVEPAYVW